MAGRLKILFGAGNIGIEALKFYGEQKVYCFCDNKLASTVIAGKPVISFEELQKIYENYDVVISIEKWMYVKEVKKQLENNNIEYTFFWDEYEKEQGKGNAENIFADIYKLKNWGCEGNEKFYSGSGSHREDIISPYIDLLGRIIQDNNIKSICDIGCGDFNIMERVLKKYDHISYVGIDVVKDLIRYNQNNYSNDKVKFVHMDASEENAVLPMADLLIIRQVLQHLDNERISRILSKIDKYKFVLITEHIYEGEDVVYNLDMFPGKNVRAYRGSGVFIEEEPFNIKHVVHVLNVPENSGVLRTSIVVN